MESIDETRAERFLFSPYSFICSDSTLEHVMDNSSQHSILSN